MGTGNVTSRYAIKAKQDTKHGKEQTSGIRMLARSAIQAIGLPRGRFLVTDKNEFSKSDDLTTCFKPNSFTPNACNTYLANHGTTYDHPQFEPREVMQNLVQYQAEKANLLKKCKVSVKVT